MSSYGKCDNCGDDLTTLCTTCADEEEACLSKQWDELRSDLSRLKAENERLKADLAASRKSLAVANAKINQMEGVKK